MSQFQVITKNYNKRCFMSVYLLGQIGKSLDFLKKIARNTHEG